MRNTMGRKRQSSHDHPPHFHLKGKTFYYVTSTSPRQWINLGKDKQKALIKWAEIEGAPDSSDGFARALDEMMSSKWHEGLSEASKVAYKKAHEPLKAFFKGFDLCDIKPHHIAMWLDNHKSPVMANIGRALVSNVMQAAVRRGEIDRNPCKDMAGLIVNSRTRYMTDDEFRSIRAKANDLVQSLMDICYLTGLRISDLLKLKVTDIEGDSLYVIQQKTKSKQKYVMTPELSAAINTARSLHRSVKNLSLIFCTRDGKPYSYSTINRMWWDAKNAAGVKDARFHDIRAKAATDAKQQGLNYQALLGHATIAMSEKYIRRREYVSAQPLKKKL